MVTCFTLLHQKIMSPCRSERKCQVLNPHRQEDMRTQRGQLFIYCDQSVNCQYKLHTVKQSVRTTTTTPIKDANDAVSLSECNNVVALLHLPHSCDVDTVPDSDNITTDLSNKTTNEVKKSNSNKLSAILYPFKCLPCTPGVLTWLRSVTIDTVSLV